MSDTAVCIIPFQTEIKEEHAFEVLKWSIAVSALYIKSHPSDPFQTGLPDLSAIHLSLKA